MRVLIRAMCPKDSYKAVVRQERMVSEENGVEQSWEAGIERACGLQDTPAAMRHCQKFTIRFHEL